MLICCFYFNYSLNVSGLVSYLLFMSIDVLYTYRFLFTIQNLQIIQNESLKKTPQLLLSTCFNKNLRKPVSFVRFQFLPSVYFTV